MTKRDLRAEALAALNALDEQHRKIQHCSEMMILTPAMEQLPQFFSVAERVTGEIAKLAKAGNTEAKKIMMELAPRFEESSRELEKSSAHVMRIYQLSFQFLATDPEKLPKA